MGELSTIGMGRIRRLAGGSSGFGVAVAEAKGSILSLFIALYTYNRVVQ
jgi:hypothetical protein